MGSRLLGTGVRSTSNSDWFVVTSIYHTVDGSTCKSQSLVLLNCKRWVPQVFYCLTWWASVSHHGHLLLVFPLEASEMCSNLEDLFDTLPQRGRVQLYHSNVRRTNLLKGNLKTYTCIRFKRRVGVIENTNSTTLECYMWHRVALFHTLLLFHARSGILEIENMTILECDM